MPTVDDNREAWGGYDWRRGGDEWSEAWGGPAFQWWGALLPRIRSLLPAPTILELAPGYGRWTQFLAPLCQSLILVDVAERCIEACRERFAAETHIAYHVNDGRTLPPLPDRSLDFVFSFDSLVHVEADVLGGYLDQLGAKLAPEGAGFFHHSNLGAFVDASTGELSIPNPHWRAPTMSAARFAELCGRAGLVCVTQECVNWGGPHLTDCFSLFTSAGSRLSGLAVRAENKDFMAEAEGVRRLAQTWGPVHAVRQGSEGASDPPSTSRAPAGKPSPGWLARSLKRLGLS